MPGAHLILLSNPLAICERAEYFQALTRAGFNGTTDTIGCIGRIDGERRVQCETRRSNNSNFFKAFHGLLTGQYRR